MPESADESRDRGCRLDVVRNEDIQIVTWPKHCIATEPLDPGHSFRVASIACRSSCSRPLGERTVSGFKRVNMTNVDMAPPPWRLLLNDSCALAQELDINQ